MDIGQSGLVGQDAPSMLTVKYLTSKEKRGRDIVETLVMEIHALDPQNKRKSVLHVVVSLWVSYKTQNISSLKIYYNRNGVILFHFGSIGDSYPKKYGCKAKHSCAKLKQKGKCYVQWKSTGIPKWCLNKLSKWEKKQRVNKYGCRRTCSTCRPKERKTSYNQNNS